MAVMAPRHSPMAPGSFVRWGRQRQIRQIQIQVLVDERDGPEEMGNSSWRVTLW